MTLDLNDPYQARKWLSALESSGRLAFDEMDQVEDLSDEEVLDVAAIVFLKSDSLPIGRSRVLH